MLGGRIDREAWAREIDALIVRFDPGPDGSGNKSAFARRIGLVRQTVIRWLRQETDISPESVRQVLDSLHLSRDEQAGLLTRVGYLTAAGEFPAPPVVQDPRDDPVIVQILADKTLTEQQQVELVQIQLDRIEADLVRRREEYLRLRRLFGGQQAS